MQGMKRFNLPPLPAIMSKKEYRQRVQQTNNVLMEEARKEIDFLRTELSSTQGLNAQLQQLLEEDSESHPSNKQARADRAELIKVRKELSELHSKHWITERELEKAKATHE